MFRILYAQSFRVDQTGGFVVNQATGGVVMVDDEDDDVNHTENNWQWFDSDAAEESGHIGSNTSNGLHDDSFADMGCVTVDYVVPDDISNINDGAHDEKPFHSITTEFSDLSSHVTSAYMVNLSTPSSLITAHRSRLLSTLRYLPSLQQLQCYLHRILPQPLIGNMTVRWGTDCSDCQVMITRYPIMRFWVRFCFCFFSGLMILPESM